jgi:hypothetical protein
VSSSADLNLGFDSQSDSHGLLCDHYFAQFFGWHTQLPKSTVATLFVASCTKEGMTWL